MIETLKKISFIKFLIYLSVLLIVFFFAQKSFGAEYYLYTEPSYSYNSATTTDLDWKLSQLGDFPLYSAIHYADAVNFCASSTIFGTTTYRLPTRAEILKKQEQATSYTEFFISSYYSWAKKGYTTYFGFKAPATTYDISLTTASAQTSNQKVCACVRETESAGGNIVVASSTDFTIIDDIMNNDLTYLGGVVIFLLAMIFLGLIFNSMNPKK